MKAEKEDTAHVKFIVPVPAPIQDSPNPVVHAAEGKTVPPWPGGRDAGTAASVPRTVPA